MHFVRASHSSSAFFFIGTATAQTVDLAGLKRQLASLDRDLRNIDTAIARQQEENARIVNDLSQVTDEPEVVTFARLRQAQFEVDIARTRILTLAHRISEQSQRVAQQSAAIVRTTAALRADERDTLQQVVDVAAIDWRERIRTAENTMLERLQRYQELSQDYLNLREEQLDILQRFIDLEALDGVGDQEASPIVTRLRRLVDQLSQQALTLSNEASEIDDGNAAAVQRRNLLRLRSDEALLRSNTRLTDIAIVESRSILAALQPIRTEPAVPIRLFDDAIATLAAAAARLIQRADTIALNRDGLSDLTRILSEPGQDASQAEALRERISGLRGLLASQAREIDDLREVIGNEIAALQRERTLRDRADLLTRETARTDKAARARIAAEIRTIPGELRSIYESRYLEIVTAVQVAPQRQLVVFGVICLLFLGLTIYLRHSPASRFISSAATRATEVPLEVMRRNLYLAVPGRGLVRCSRPSSAISATTMVADLETARRSPPWPPRCATSPR